MAFKVKTKGQNEGENLLIPKLRFKEFNDEWKEVSLKKTFTFFSTNSLSRADLTADGLIKNIHYGDIHQKFNNILDVEKEKLPYINPNIMLNIKNNLCQNGDLIFADASEDYEGIGKAIEIINIGKNKVVSGLHTIHARDIDSTMSIGFKGYLFNTPIIHNQIRILANGFKVFGISKNDICNLNVRIPSKIEQEKISKFLILLDKKIELQKRKVDALKIYKKGLIQQLFNLNDCEEKHVSDFGDILTGTTPSKAISKYWTNGNIAWITPTDITENKDIYTSNEKLTIDGLDAGRFIPAGSILITCIASIGKNAILKVNGSCNQQINAIIPNDNFNSDYLYYLFELKKDYLQSIAGTSATSIINKSAFEKLVFKVHDIKVQNKIALILNCLELKFEIEKSKLAKLKLLKKSLLQQMFI